jgi:phosphohistidine phosphatase
MKTLILARHAKSSWEDPDWTDFERPINKFGKKALPSMATQMKELLGDAKPLIISSPANRAITTAKKYADIFEIPHDDIIQDMDIYHLGTRYILNLIKKQADSIDTLMIVGHNPDITSLASVTTGNYIDNVPTGAWVCVDFDADNWAKIESKTGQLRLFAKPLKKSKK